MTARKTTTRTRRPRKGAKTIDLTAGDVTKKTSEPSSSDESSPPSDASAREEPGRDPDDARIDEPAMEDVEAAAQEGQSDTVTPESSDEPSGDADDVRLGEPVTEDAAKAAADTAVEDGLSEPEADSAPEHISEQASEAAPLVIAPAGAEKKGGFGPGLLGGLVGGAAMVGLGFVGLQQGIVSLPGNEAVQSAQQSQLAAMQQALDGLKGQVESAAEASDLSPLTGRISALEEEIVATKGTISKILAGAGPVQDGQDGQGGGDASGGDQVASGSMLAGSGVSQDALAKMQTELDVLTEQLAGLEALNAQFASARVKLSSLETLVAEQGALIESKAAEQMAALNAGLQKAQDDILSSADRRIDNVVTDLRNLSEKVGTEATSLAGRITSLEENNLSAEMQSSARTIALANLEQGVASGGAYSVALGAFTDIVGASEASAMLATYAKSGVATKAELAKQFSGVYDGVMREAEEAGAATLLDKFLLNAQSLVKVRSLSGEKKGESLTNKLGIIDYQVREGNLDKAAVEWDGLPPAARDSKAGAEWIAALKARLAVDGAMDTIRADFGKAATQSAQ